MNRTILRVVHVGSLLLWVYVLAWLPIMRSGGAEEDLGDFTYSLLSVSELYPEKHMHVSNALIQNDQLPRKTLIGQTSSKFCTLRWLANSCISAGLAEADVGPTKGRDDIWLSRTRIVGIF
jgi:hypothetical protein